MAEDTGRTLSSSTSVCRAFFNEFTAGTCRKHDKLVLFLMEHSSSRAKIEDWIQSVETPEISRSGRTPGLDRNNLSPSGSTHLKSDEKSLREREYGNETFKKKDLAKSLHHYNQAIMLASFPATHDERLEDKSQKKLGSCLCLAFANRSAVLVELGASYYDNALLDIESAFKYGYPESLKGKLLLRKANIYTQQRQYQHALECINEIRRLGAKEIDQVTSSTSTSFEDKIQELEMQIDQLKISNKDMEKNMNIEDKNAQCETTFLENIEFENASDKITLQAVNREDRRVIALEELNKGDLLFKEDPFASVLLSDFYNSHCHHCHKFLPDSGCYFFPCKTCSQVKFCDDKCMDSANVYHQHECTWLDLMHSVGIAHLAIRIILVAGIDNILKCVQNHATYSNIENLLVFEKAEDPTSYLRVYALLDHVKEIHIEDLFHYTLTAALLTRFLICKTSFFKDHPVKEQALVGGAILRHICQLICNAHAITNVLEEHGFNEAVVDESQQRIATAIFPAASMMNHSCHPNINFQFKNGKTLMVKASRCIERGREVYNCYGPHFQRMPVNERQEALLQQYFFSCTCTECTREITSGFSFANQFSAYRCTNCDGPVNHSDQQTDVVSIDCAKCGATLQMKPALDSLNTIRDLLEKGQYLMEKKHDWNKAIKILKSCHMEALKTLYKQHSSLGKVCDSLAQCYAMTGNFEEASNYLRLSLEYVENRFGKDSIEFARELVKFQEVSQSC